MQAPGLCPRFEVVGIAADAKYESLRSAAPPTVYLPMTQMSYPTYAVRSSGDPTALVGTAATVAKAVEPRMRLSFRTLSDQLSASLTREQLLATMSVFFGILTMLLATIGVYGIMAYGVSRRRNEIGLRIAVGATPRDVIGMIVGDVGRIVVAGVVIGAAAAIASTRLIGSLLYGIGPSDPWVFVGSAGGLILVAVGASLLPAVRAARLDPVAALREE